jgi:hypothetical protein
LPVCESHSCPSPGTLPCQSTTIHSFVNSCSAIRERRGRTWWNVPRDARIEPPSQEEYILSAAEAGAPRHSRQLPCHIRRRERARTNLNLCRARHPRNFRIQAIHETLREGSSSRDNDVGEEDGVEVRVDLHEGVGEESVERLEGRVRVRGDRRGGGGKGSRRELRTGVSHMTRGQMKDLHRRGGNVQG